MPDTPSRRAFLLGVLSCGALTAAATYFTPGGKPTPSVRLTLLTGADSTGGRDLLFDMWNAANPDTQVNVIEVPGQTADQRKRMSDAAANGSADVLNLDIIDIPEFAGRGLLSRIELRKDRFLERAIATGRVSADSDEYWAAPFNTDVGMLFERLTAGSAPGENPRLSTAIDSLAPGSLGFVGQVTPGSSASYEAFVVNVLEHALSHDGGILDGNGIPSYELLRWKDALAPLREAIETRRVLQAADEEETLARFTTEPRPRYMRNWPVYYRRLQTTDADAQQGRIKVRSLPIGVLGGQSLAVVARSAHQARARQLIEFLTSDEAQKVLAAHGLAPTRVAAYADPNLQAFIPHLKETLRGAVEQARPRPVHPSYGAFAEAFVRHMRPLLADGVELPSKFIDDIRTALPGTS
jgi:multiple sugar transport system substrate-binding protein